MSNTSVQARAAEPRATQGRTLRERAALGGLVLGAIFGLTFTLASSSAPAERQFSSSKTILDATHLPPLLTIAGEDVVLRYDAHCASAVEEPDAAATCRATGSVFIRSGASGPFQAIPLAIDATASEGRYVARVPTSTVRSPRGFSYYAVLSAGEASVTLPAGGADAPHRSLPLGRPVAVSLGRHEFGQFRRADARALEASWGNGFAQIGLEGGVNIAPAGGSSFDVDAGGNVFVLDQVRRRVLRWMPTASTPSAIPVSVDGTIADLAVAEDGTMYVLEGARADRGPALSTFDRSGRALSVAELGERTATQVKVGPTGALVLQHPSGQWLPAARDGSPLSALAQVRAGLPGRVLPDGRELVILRTGNEIRVALFAGHGVRRSWRIASASSLAEVQLAEPMGDGVLVVVRVYSDTEDEFVALVLGRRGLLARMSLDSADWAESAPLGRFRLVGTSLYRLGSTQTGLFVDRFDLEVTQ